MENEDRLYAIEIKSSRKKRDTVGLQKFASECPKAIPLVVNPENFEKFMEAKDLKILINK